MKIVKYIPNSITLLRIAGAISLIFIEPMSVLFLVVFGVCGATDVVDGFIARKFHVESRLGSVLDTLCDFALYIIMVIRLWYIIVDTFQVGTWVVAISACALRVVSYGICFLKYKKFSSVHTYMNKVLGFSFFLFPFVCLAPSLAILIYSYVAGSVALIGSIEEILIHSVSKVYNVHNKSIFLVKRNERNNIPTDENE